MRMKYLLSSLAALLFCLSVWGPPSARGAGQVDVIVDNGVTREAESATRQAIDATMDFFKRNYGLSMERKLEIFIVPDQRTHVRELRQRYSMPGSMASRNAKNFGGIASGGVIVVNTNRGGRQNYMDTVCHELVHVFQNQESRGNRYGSIKYMTEGVAQVVAAQIMAAAGIKGPYDPGKLWPAVLKKAGRTPRLEHLRTYRDWDTAGRTYGYRVVYTTAALAALNLLKEKGSKPLFAFFRNLRKNKPEAAFYQAFGINLSEFEKSFRPY